MADEVIVNEVVLEGSAEVEAQLESLGSKGKEAFGTLTGSTAAFNNEAARVASVGAQVTSAFDKFGHSLRNIGTASKAVVSNVGNMGKSLLKWGSIIGVSIAIASKLSQSQDQAADDSKEAVQQARLESRALEQVNQQREQNIQAIKEFDRATQASSQAAATNTQRTIEDLETAFRRGEITKQQLTTQTQKVQEDAATASVRRMQDEQKERAKLILKQQEEAEIQRQLALSRSAEAESRLRATIKIQEEAKARKAWAASVKSVGADTAGALVQFGIAWDKLMDKFNAGPSVIAAAIRSVAQFINENGSEIVNTLDDIGAKFVKLFDDGSGKATDFGALLMKGFRDVADLIRNVVFPVFKVFLTVLDGIAAVINTVFGTNFSGGAIAAIAILFQLLGVFKLIGAILTSTIFLFNALRIAMLAAGATPFGLVIAAIVVALGLLIFALSKVDWEKFGAGALAVVNNVIGYFVDLGKRIVEDFNASVKQITDLWDSIIKFFTDLGERIVTGFWKTIEDIKKAFASVVTYLEGTWVGKAVSAIQKVIGWAGKLVDVLKEAFKAQKDIDAERTAAMVAEGFKRGGPIGGSGSTTGDGIPIWASPKEWVIRAAAAQYYGSRFMNAVNSMRFPKDGFALPNLAQAVTIPTTGRTHFATGGEVSRPSRILNLTLQGIGTFPGLSGPDETLDRLTTIAIRGQVRSAGRLPNWAGGRP